MGHLQMLLAMICCQCRNVFWPSSAYDHTERRTWHCVLCNTAWVAPVVAVGDFCLYSSLFTTNDVQKSPRSPLKSKRFGWHTAGGRLVVSSSMHHFRYVLTTIARDQPNKRAISDIDVPSRQAITIYQTVRNLQLFPLCC